MVILEDKLKIIAIKKCDDKIITNIGAAYQKTKILALCALLFLINEKGIVKTTPDGIIAAGSACFGTISMISLVKSLCEIYQLNEKKKALENDGKTK